jgi:hypothetical protein
MLDIDHAKGTVANAVGPMLGTATGGLLSGLLVQYLPAPTQLVYIVLGVVFVVQAFGVALMPESVTPRPGALASLRPHFRLPAAARAAVFIAAPALIATWSLVGFYGALGPTLVRRISGSPSIALGGFSLFVFAASGALAVLLTRQRTPRALMLGAMAALIGGVALTLFAIRHESIAWLFAGIVVAGTGFGAGFQGAIRTVVPLAAAHERAGVLSILYVIAYLAMGLPAVLGGLRVVHGGGLLGTAREFGLAVMALATIALGGTLLRGGVAIRRRWSRLAIW